MARHVEDYASEWKGVLDDPDKLSRFVSFVNAPEAPTPPWIHRAKRPKSACGHGHPVRVNLKRTRYDPARRHPR